VAGSAYSSGDHAGKNRNGTEHPTIDARFPICGRSGIPAPVTVCPRPVVWIERYSHIGGIFKKSQTFFNDGPLAGVSSGLALTDPEYRIEFGLPLGGTVAEAARSHGLSHLSVESCGRLNRLVPFELALATRWARGA
jgi:hypothetical protein